MILLGLAAVLILSTIVWAISLRLENASIADVAWGPAILVIGLTYYFTSDVDSLRARVTLVLLAIWAIRLAVHIGSRNRLEGEDYRYMQWRDQYGESWWWFSYFKVFVLQAVIAWIVSLPIYFAVVSLPSGLNLLDYLGVVLFVTGLIFEGVGDEQLRRFRMRRENKGKVLDTGLWRYTRHPNYFGETLLWWGFGLIGLATGGVPGLLGPVVLTYLLLYVSGVAMLEASLVNKPGYVEYAGRTPALVPLPPQVRAQLVAKFESLQKKPEPPQKKRYY